MEITIIPVTAFQQNCSLLWCPETMRGVVVDPGGDVDDIMAEVEERGVTLERILITHGHIDHIGGAGELAQRTGVPIEGPHVGDADWIRELAQQGRMFGVRPGRTFTPDRWLEAGEVVRFGTVEMQVLHCPGHSPGHVAFFCAGENLALVGDVLFQGSIGRTDFPGGDYETLIRSIREQLLPLGDDVTFIPGHGPASTFGAERRTNPFLVK
ncbi:MAG: MBL fold metallo-hydrolase [Alphaproteobacteria bacterium]|nr:MBL fold metallo-hydrolase [Alphaproteobacteria bacterium]MBF0128473.1 MBL fold metallo-hydrolase [Alphaproteobacteria bacterium]